MPLLKRLTGQVLAAMILDHPFTHPPVSSFPGFSTPAVLDILAAVHSYFLLSPRSIGRQRLTSRHRSPLKFRRPHDLVGPAAHRDPRRSLVGAIKALQFFSWAKSFCNFNHCERTCLAVAGILARADNLDPLWAFLRENRDIINTKTVTAIIKILGEEGLVKEAYEAFHRIRYLHCKPDVQCYNTLIYQLCRVRDFKKAKLLLRKMELPGSRYPADTYTYTIFISSYCKWSMQTGCKKMIMSRLYKATHMYRDMLFKGFKPDVVTYNCLIDGLCKTDRVERAHEMLDEMVKRGCLPNKVTYNSLVRCYSAINEVDKGIKMMRLMVSRGHGVPTCSSYTPIIHTLCEVGRVREARDFLLEMVDGGSIPRVFTYKLVCDALKSAGEEGIPVELSKIIERRMDARCRRAMKVKAGWMQGVGEL